MKSGRVQIPSCKKDASKIHKQELNKFSMFAALSETFTICLNATHLTNVFYAQLQWFFSPTFCAKHSSQSHVQIHHSQVLGTCKLRDTETRCFLQQKYCEQSCGFMLICRKVVHIATNFKWSTEQLCIMCCRKERKWKQWPKLMQKSSCRVKRENPLTTTTTVFKNTYFSSWELAAISDLSVLSARGHPDTLERIKS